VGGQIEPLPETIDDVVGVLFVVDDHGDPNPPVIPPGGSALDLEALVSHAEDDLRVLVAAVGAMQ
jgi:hypothetical protein